MTRVLIACAHEPELDPRIDWAARHAPEDVHRLVLGFTDERRPRPAYETISDCYAVHRISRATYGAFDAFCYLMKEALVSAPWRIRLSLTAMLALALPVVLAYELVNIVANLVRASVWLPRIVFGWLLRGSVLFRLARKVWRRVASAALAMMNYKRLLVFREMLCYIARTNAALLANAKLIEDVDVVHVNDLETLPAGVLMKWSSKAKLIFDSHEYWPHSDVENSLLEVAFWKWLERALVQQVDRAVTVSQPLAAELSSSYNKPFCVVPNCEPVTLAYSKISPRKPDPDGYVRFLYHGNFAPERGLEELIAGWSRLKCERAQLYLRGPQNQYRDRCITLARELGVEGRTVGFPPAVLECELVTTASDFDVGVIPYKSRALAYRFCCPNKLSQYMQAGLAILTNELIFVNEVIVKYGCGLSYDADRLETLVTAVEALLSDPQLLFSSKQNAKKAALEDFNWQAKSSPLYEAYRRAA
jgi:glycosyltransferase involved in cell wall biosynthesis